MQRSITGAAVMAIMLALSGCVDYDVADPVRRAELGGAFGATAGAALGAAFAINPGLGALIGAAGGAALGAAAGYASAEPLPSYAPIALPGAAAIPGFYDSWPPGFVAPPPGSQTPPPPRSG